MKIKYRKYVLAFLLAIVICTGCTKSPIESVIVVEYGDNADVYVENGLDFDGTLNICIEDVQIFTALEEAGLKPEDIHDFSLYSNESGDELGEDNKLILTKVKIKNIDAVNTDINVTDEYAFSLGCLKLVPVTSEKLTGMEEKEQAEYYDKPSEVDSVHAKFYYINPGESINITMGYIIEGDEYSDYFLAEEGEIGEVHYFELDL